VRWMHLPWTHHPSTEHRPEKHNTGRRACEPTTKQHLVKTRPSRARMSGIRMGAMPCPRKALRCEGGWQGMEEHTTLHWGRGINRPTQTASEQALRDKRCPLLHYYRNLKISRWPIALGVDSIAVGVVYAEGCSRRSSSA
jgi:hypothetical protein